MSGVLYFREVLDGGLREYVLSTEEMPFLVRYFISSECAKTFADEMGLGFMDNLPEEGDDDDG